MRCDIEKGPQIVVENSGCWTWKCNRIVNAVIVFLVSNQIAVTVPYPCTPNWKCVGFM